MRIKVWLGFREEKTEPAAKIIPEIYLMERMATVEVLPLIKINRMLHRL